MGFRIQVFGKAMTKVIIVGIVSLVISVILSNCEETKMQPQYEALTGKWETVYYLDDEQVGDVLKALAFTEEEIAVIGTEGFCYIKIAEFTEDKHYSFTNDVTETKKRVHAFFQKAIVTLYEQREKLNAVYGETAELTQREFLQRYAETYDVKNYEELLSLLVENALDYDLLSQNSETGTFELKKDRIVCTESGKVSEKALGFELTDNTLTLTYANGKENYTRSSE